MKAEGSCRAKPIGYLAVQGFADVDLLEAALLDRLRPCACKKARSHLALRFRLPALLHAEHGCGLLCVDVQILGNENRFICERHALGNRD